MFRILCNPWLRNSHLTGRFLMSQWGMKTENPMVVTSRHWFISRVSRGQRPSLITWDVNILKSLMWSWGILFELLTLTQLKVVYFMKISKAKNNRILFLFGNPHSLPHSWIQEFKMVNQMPYLTSTLSLFFPCSNRSMSVKVNHTFCVEVVYCVSL